MRIRSLGFLLLLLSGLMPAIAQAPIQALAKADEKPEVKGPSLEPGEGFAVAEVNGGVQVFGEGGKPGPMGSLAKLVWLELEGSEWGSQLLLFKCTGNVKGHPCGLPKGHGRVDLPKALQVDCHNAFQAWIQISLAMWRDVYGEGPSRTRLVEAFSPFLENRLPAGNDLPTLDGAWIGQGPLLQTSPEAFARWLADPAQENLLNHAKRNLNGFFSDSPWWFQVGTSPVPGAAAVSRSIVVGSDGRRVFVLSLPPGKDRTEALQRMKAILGLPAK